MRGLVLAGGAGARFGGAKVEARIAGRPILQHVLDALAEAGFDDPIVVLAPDSTLEPSLEWRRAPRAFNPDPARGLSSSPPLGCAAALAADPPPHPRLDAPSHRPPPPPHPLCPSPAP